MIRRLPALTVLLLLLSMGAAAYVLIRDDDSPSYSPLEIEGDPYAYESGREDEFAKRAAAGHSHVVYAKSPGGVLATAHRVEAFRDEIEDAADDAGVDADLIEGMVLLESAGRPDARTSDDLEGAVGLTQMLAATGRYLKLAKDEFGREDLAVVSYHMGIGNLQQLLGAYGDDDASYAQLFFDTAPNRHPRAYRLLTGLGDDSKTYLWRVLASHEVMRLYRDDRAQLARLAELHAQADSGELMLHPPDETGTLETPDAVEDAYTAGELRPFPNEPSRYGLRPATAGGGLRPEAFALAVYIGQGVRKVSGIHAPLTVTRTVRPGAGIHATGFAFDIRRRYRSGAQAEAFQFMLDRLQALNLIVWTRDSGTIHITASGEFDFAN